MNAFKGIFGLWGFVGIAISAALTVGLFQLANTARPPDVGGRHDIIYSKVEPDVYRACSGNQKNMTIFVHYKAIRRMPSTSQIVRWISNEEGVVVATITRPGIADLGKSEHTVPVDIPCLPVGKYSLTSAAYNKFSDGRTSVEPSIESSFTVVSNKPERPEPDKK